MVPDSSDSHSILHLVCLPQNGTGNYADLHVGSQALQQRGVLPGSGGSGLRGTGFEH